MIAGAHTTIYMIENTSFVFMAVSVSPLVFGGPVLDGGPEPVATLRDPGILEEAVT